MRQVKEYVAKDGTVTYRVPDATRKVYAHLLPAVGVAAGRSASAAMERVLATSQTRALPRPGVH